MGPWNRKEIQETDPHKCSQLIFDEGTKQYNGAKIVFFTNGAKTTGHLHVHARAHTHTNKKINLGTGFTPFTKLNSKWIRDLSVKHKTMKFPGGNKGKSRTPWIW